LILLSAIMFWNIYKMTEKQCVNYFRVLKLGGFAILQVPISKNIKETFENFSIILPEEREKYFGQKDHVRIYDQDYNKKLENISFEIKFL